ncbi:hypothetical protein DM860_007584 [Cuscuta australis]|uniref:PB1 domain-containing protein n=1 Tax=Cuscuta australis TaxID=267555 RepID=A0A328E5U5_9ASTE|nr:hypothetical protein DM860_007584 [Cuscuta australis]
MGKPLGRKKSGGVGGKKQGKDSGERTSKAFDEDTAVFINMSRELKEEGNRLFQSRDHEGAMLKYEKAIKLLPRDHIDVAYLHSNMAACYMQMGIGEFPRAIAECNLALEVAPKYSKALLKRAKCYEALNRLDLALRDVRHVLSVEPNNVTALETAGVVKRRMEERGQTIDEDKEIKSPPPPENTKVKKKKGNKKTIKVAPSADERKVEDVKLVVEEEKISVKEEKKVKLVLGEDIRWAQLPINCTVRLARDIALDRFPNLKGALLKYRDQEGDLVTITTNDELRLAKASVDPQGSLRLYVAEVSPDKEPAYETSVEEEMTKLPDNSKKEESGGPICIEEWIVEFARYFKNHVGIECDSYLDIHEIGMKLYSEAMEGTVTSENAASLFDISLAKFQEMTALALFNWGNVHMSRARKRVCLKEYDDDAKESVLGQVKSAYEWAHKEYEMAGRRYEESVRLKPDFYEGLLALGQQQFELAKLCWYYQIASETDLLLTMPSPEVLEMYNKAEENLERGMEMWEEMEEERLNGLSKYEEHKAQLRDMGLDGLLKDITPEEAQEQATNMRSQIYLLWGTLLYERSVMEYKAKLPSWEECLEVAVEKFELAGASQTDIAVMIKNHNSNDTALEGFKIDEIVQAWNEMYDSNRWRTGVPAFRLEPLFRRRVPHLHSLLQTF